MAWLFGQTWLWYLLAFAVGVLLAWLLFVLPARRRQRTAVAAPATSAAAAPAASAAATTAPTRRRIDEAATEQLPAVDPALSTLDSSSGSAGIGAAGVAALGAAGVAASRRADRNDDGPRAQPSDDRDIDSDTTRIPVVPPPDRSADEDTAVIDTTGLATTAPAGDERGSAEETAQIPILRKGGDTGTGGAPLGVAAVGAAGVGAVALGSQRGADADPAGTGDTPADTGAARAATTDGRAAGDQAADARATDGHTTDGHATDAQATDAQATDAQATDVHTLPAAAGADPTPAGPADGQPDAGPPDDAAPGHAAGAGAAAGVPAAQGFVSAPAGDDARAGGVVPGRFPGSALPLDGGDPPTAAHTIKGNAQSMLYHSTASPYYSRTKAEVWFTSAADAEAAGFTDVRSRRR